MKVLYGSQDLWEIIENGFVEPENQTGLTQQANELKENCKKDKKTLFFIYQVVDEVIFERISTATSAKAVWDTLQTIYQGEDKVKMVRLQALRSEFDTLKMKDSESVEEFFNRVLLIVNQLKVNGEQISDQRIVKKILRSMTRKFEHVVVTIEESRDLSTLSVNSLMGSLQSHELRLKQFDTTPLEQAFQSQASFNQSSRGRRGGRGGGRNFESRNNNNDSKEESNSSSSQGRGRGRDRGRGRSRSQGRGRGNFSHIQCYNCNHFGHTQAYCRLKKNDGDRNNSNFIHEEQNNDDSTLFLACKAQEFIAQDVWYLDSGCSNHMTGNKDIFAILDDSLQSEVKIGDDKC